MESSSAAHLPVYGPSPKPQKVRSFKAKVMELPSYSNPRCRPEPKDLKVELLDMSIADKSELTSSRLLDVLWLVSSKKFTSSNEPQLVSSWSGFHSEITESSEERYNVFFLPAIPKSPTSMVLCWKFSFNVN